MIVNLITSATLFPNEVPIMGHGDRDGDLFLGGYCLAHVTAAGICRGPCPGVVRRLAVKSLQASSLHCPCTHLWSLAPHRAGSAAWGRAGCLGAPGECLPPTLMGRTSLQLPCGFIERLPGRGPARLARPGAFCLLFWNVDGLYLTSLWGGKNVL